MSFPFLFTDVDLEQLVMNAANEYGGGGGGGGPGDGTPSRTNTSRDRNVGMTSVGISKRGVSRKSALEKANEEAEAAREAYKRRRIIGDGNEGVVGEGEVGGVIGKSKRYDRRLLMNRRSAGASRVRKDVYLKSLEKHLVALDEKVNVMERELSAAKGENLVLRNSGVENVDVEGLALFPDIDEFLDEAARELER